MALSEQERKCVEATCRFLDLTRGGTWEVRAGPTLDDLHPHEPSPEALVTNGVADATVEVKRLGNDITQPYLESVVSLERYLAPSCGGYYTLTPCANLSFPLNRKLMRQLKREIERVAPSLQDGETCPVAIERSALLVVRSRNGSNMLQCCHTAFALLQDISSRLDGIYALLVDQDQMEHSFVTEDQREQFAQAVISAARSGESQTITWKEEWPLERLDGNDTGVYVLGTSAAFNVQTSVSLSAERMMEQALEKFRGRRWAATHIIALESQSPHMTPDRVHEALLAFNHEELQGVDLVLLVVDGEAHLVLQQ